MRSPRRRRRMWSGTRAASSPAFRRDAPARRQHGLVGPAGKIEACACGQRRIAVSEAGEDLPVALDGIPASGSPRPLTAPVTASESPGRSDETWVTRLPVSAAKRTRRQVLRNGEIRVRDPLRAPISTTAVAFPSASRAVSDHFGHAGHDDQRVARRATRRDARNRRRDPAGASASYQRKTQFLVAEVLPCGWITRDPDALVVEDERDRRPAASPAAGRTRPVPRRPVAPRRRRAKARRVRAG